MGSDRPERMPQEKGRDGERTPMQWDRSGKRRLLTGDALAAGGHPLIRPTTWPSSRRIRISVLQFLHKGAKLRHTNHALLEGTTPP